MVRIEVCTTTSQWSRYTEFYIAHRTSIVPGYPVALALKDVRDTMRQGRGGLLTNEADEAIGIGSFVLGLAEEGFGRKEIAVLGNSCFTERYRRSRTFVRGLQALAEQIAKANPDAAEVRIPTAADNAYTNRLYGKLAKLSGTRETDYGTVNVYSLPYADFAAFCRRYS